VSVVPLPDPLVQIRGEVAGRDRVVGAANVGFEVPEEPFDGLSVYVSADVDALRVVDPAVAVARIAGQRDVPTPVVGEDHRSGQHERLSDLARVAPARNDGGANPALALDRADDNRAGLARRTPVRSAGRSQPRPIRLAQLAADERLIDLDLSRQRLVVLSHEFRSNLAKHPERGLVVHADLAFELLRGDPAL